jgi:hypothetical protein
MKQIYNPTTKTYYKVKKRSTRKIKLKGLWRKNK